MRVLEVGGQLWVQRRVLSPSLLFLSPRIFKFDVHSFTVVQYTKYPAILISTHHTSPTQKHEVLNSHYQHRYLAIQHRLGVSKPSSPPPPNTPDPYLAPR